MATDALSLQALNAFAVVMRSVLKSNGYRTDIGKHVSIEADYGSELARKGPVMFIGAAAMPINQQISGNKTRARTMNLVFEFATPASLGTIHQLAHNGLADMLDVLPRCSGKVDGVSSLVIDSSDILRRPEGFPGVVAQITAHVTLTERTPVARED